MYRDAYYKDTYYKITIDCESFRSLTIDDKDFSLLLLDTFAICKPIAPFAWKKANTLKNSSKGNFRRSEQRDIK